jgi:hypothetical protein
MDAGSNPAAYNAGGEISRLNYMPEVRRSDAAAAPLCCRTPSLSPLEGITEKNVEDLIDC